MREKKEGFLIKKNFAVILCALLLVTAERNRFLTSCEKLFKRKKLNAVE